ncbi:tetratricopeptide repeat protein [Mycolicibacterium sp. 018/SC-01/001]|uniref:tetratricopeptide repeat protein n=1 Tax=Mycolicibacterium sp. 018/SC-01/001 TaxID=2592069 RepID=UPI002104ED86|nr:tetratricopeptide repeat protein [Mycolicibacterium sp. 018/SC-01/001]
MPDDAAPAAGESTFPDTATGVDAGRGLPGRAAWSPVKVALVAGLAGTVALGGLTGWLGYRAVQAQRAEQARELFLQVAREGAVNLSTFNWQQVDADVQRVLDSATGTFYDDYRRRAQAFADVVKQARSTSEGTITEAGLESATDSAGQVLVAVRVTSTNAGAPEGQQRAWRMRIVVEKIGDQAKVSQVDFVS